MEPWQDINKLEEYGRKFGIHSAYANMNGKILSFVDEEIDVDIVMDMEQQMALKLFYWNLNKELYVTLVYVKCDAIERIKLWDSIYHLASDMESTWLVGGDFNVILSEEEKYGGLPLYLSTVEDFAHCVDTCALYYLGFKGSLYTWLNRRLDIDCIFKRLDRFFVVKDNWVANTMENPFILFQSKLKKVHEIDFELNPIVQNRAKFQKVEIDLTRYYYLEEEFWRQKAGMQWFIDSNRNRKFFHAHVRGKRKRLQVSKILDKNDNWLESQEEMAREAVEFFQAQFIEE
ncbi:uncharacterized protein LOC142173384 [Nicotiana tabacum]|uniref:Uncharacterized protein LOC142173384 n=1 Tax=Nicotiana tabacum TaxID=4097 RepID=A0AC58TCW8_TOBAC